MSEAIQNIGIFTFVVGAIISLGGMNKDDKFTANVGSVMSVVGGLMVGVTYLLS